jgi:CheY-like chemotaxis protein
MTATPHLLIVDDDKETGTLLSRFLTRYGYRVSIAQDGRVMTQVLETARINLIVLDVMLPGEEDSRFAGGYAPGAPCRSSCSRRWAKRLIVLSGSR